MSKWRIFTLFILVSLFFTTASAAGMNNGVDDLRGRWDIQWQLESEGEDPLPELEVLITDIEASPTQPNIYQATGCMAIAQAGYYAPLSLQVTDLLDGSYDVIFLSTVVPGVNDRGVFIARFEGYLEVFGSGVVDDVVGGEVLTSFGSGTWTGEHHDRRRVRCPAAEPGVLYFAPDVYADVDRSANPYPVYTLFGGSTNIVSSAMQVELPDGSVVIVGYDQDIFTAHIDFISEFAFGLTLEGLPIAGEPYKITLLDNLGHPIPGTETVDYWYSCPQGAPGDPAAAYAFEDFINVSWTGVEDVPGQFEPAGDPRIGFYQIEVNPYGGGEKQYGMNLGSSTYHNIPWNPFTVDQLPDDPDGVDHGISFSELEDGLYEFRILSFSESRHDNPGFGLECQSVINAQNLLMKKSGSDLSFFRFGWISGNVTDSTGAPIEGIMVTACEYDNDDKPYCQEGQTDADGQYSIQQLMENDYRVFVQGQPGWANAFFNDEVIYENAARVAVFSGQETASIDFVLNQAGSISGSVFDDAGNPLGGIAVDTEGGGYGTCTDENGFYTLQSVPVGIHNVVAGRDFCGPHPFAESTVFEVELTPETPDVGGVDFMLEIYVEPSPQYLNVQPDHMWADSGGWPEGAEVTLSFDGYAASLLADENGNVWFPLTGSDIAVGVNVNVTDGVDSKDLLVSAASFDGVDDVENTAWGTAPAGMSLGVAVVDELGYESGFYWVDGIVADEFGNWFVDFDDAGQDFGLVIDAWVHVFDEDGDSTIAHLPIP